MENPSTPVSASEPAASVEAAPDKEEEGTSQPKAPTRCGVCEIEVAKYKCARCPLAYCSVPCSRVHRDNHPPTDPTNEPEKQPLPAEPPTPVKKANGHPFSILENSVELQHLFKKYPNLPARLRAIADQTLPPRGDALVSGGVHWSLPGAGGGGNSGHGRGRGGRGSGRGRGGRGGARGGGSAAQPKSQPNRPWTKEAGLRKGLEALRAARTDPTEDGDAVREYSELVLYILAREAGEAGEAGMEADITAGVRKEVEAGDAELVQQLMKADGDL